MDDRLACDVQQKLREEIGGVVRWVGMACGFVLYVCGLDWIMAAFDFWVDFLEALGGV